MADHPQQVSGSPLAAAPRIDNSVAKQTRRLPIAINLDVTVDLRSLIGLTEVPAAIGTDGIVPMDALRGLLAQAELVTLRRVITDPATGHRIDTGVRRYVLTERERERILARDQRCRFPDCGQPATRCECDHAHEYAAGGATRTANLGALCKRHHQCKTHGDWTITRSAADGSCEWRSPMGRRYDHGPVRVLPWSGDDVWDRESDAPAASDTVDPHADRQRSRSSDSGVDHLTHAPAVRQLLAIGAALRALRAESTDAWASGMELDTSVQRERLEDAASAVRTTVTLEDSARIAATSRHAGMLVAVLAHALAHEFSNSLARADGDSSAVPRIPDHGAGMHADAPPF